MVQSVVGGDKCSLSNILDFKVTHIDWYIIVDFSSQILTCHAVHQFECIKEGSQVIFLDTKDLNIDNFQIENKVQVAKRSWRIRSTTRNLSPSGEK